LSPQPAINSLPPELLLELDRKLIEGGFADYRGLADWLQERGYQINKDQVHRHAKGLKQSLLNVRQQALYLAEISKLMGDDDRGDLIAMACDIGIMKSIEALAELDPIEDAKKFADIERSTAALGRISLEQKKWNLISAAELEKRLKQVETDESTRDVPSSPEELISRIRQTVLGISSLAVQPVLNIEATEV
jgi:Protein of unknown function (DUF3486)